MDWLINTFQFPHSIQLHMILLKLATERALGTLCFLSAYIIPKVPVVAATQV